MLVRSTIQEKRNGDVLKDIKTVHIEIAGDKQLVELVQGLLESKFLKYHGDKYTFG